MDKLPNTAPSLTKTKSLVFNFQVVIAMTFSCSKNYLDWIMGTLGLLQWSASSLKIENVCLFA